MSRSNSQRRATESFRAGSEGKGKDILCDQIKEIVAALNDIRSQLAEQNKYLDVLTETYVKRPRAATVPSRTPAPFTFADELETVEWEGESDWGEHVEYEEEETQDLEQDEGLYQGQDSNFGKEEGIPDEMYEDEERREQEEFYQETQDEVEPEEEVFEDALDSLQENVYDNALATQLMDSLKEAIPAEKIDKQFAPPFHSIDPTVPGSTTFYLPLGLVISLFCMRFFNSKQTTHVSQIPQASFATMFIVLLLAAYIFATFTLWFLREEDWVKRVIGSWKLANPTPKSSQQEQSRDSRLPDILRRRKALETS